MQSERKENIEQFNERPAIDFNQLTSVYQIVGNTRGQNSKNIQKTHLSNLFKKLMRNSAQDLVMGYWLSVMKISPDYKKTQLGIGTQMLLKAVAKSCGMQQKNVREQTHKIGDLGEVAQSSKSTQRTMDNFFTSKKVKIPLTIKKIFSSFLKISQSKGNNSNTEREQILVNLLLQSKSEQTKFIVRWIQGNLKIAAGQKTMQKALITALFEQLFPKKQQTEENEIMYEKAIKKAMAQFPNEEVIIKTLIQIKNDIPKINEVLKLTPGVPCKPMLAKPQKNVASILNRFQGKKITCEYKYDGLRGQIHYFNKKIQIFSRNLEELTESYPDIIEKIRKSIAQTPDIQLNCFIIDCQIVAVNEKTKQLYSFQTLSTRSRKATNINDIQVHINLFAFDVLYYNEPITHLSLRQRRQYLLKLQPLFSEFFCITQHRQLDDISEIDSFLQQAIKFGTQGLMIKDLESPYTCSKRAWEWVKLKKDYIDGLGDTLDVVPLGAQHGIGKRKGLFGSYLLGVFNQDLQVYQTICKIGTGFSDQVLQIVYDFFKDKIMETCPRQYRVSTGEKVDVWFSPEVVWEIKGADFQLSPIYTCGIGQVDTNRGIGLRFPRLIKVRDDKKPKDATTNDFVIDLYKQQAVVQNKGPKEQEQDDYY